MTDSAADSAHRLSNELEMILVAKNLRGMAHLRATMQPGYLLRAAQALINSGPRVVIATGFPVDQNFETDGPAGAIALARTCSRLQKQPCLCCEPPLATRLSGIHTAIPLAMEKERLRQQLRDMQPDLLISIERPGVAADSRYYNMYREDISQRVAPLDTCLEQLNCAIIGVGDGGNELGMGSRAAALGQLNIVPSTTPCTELIVADVSNWGVYGLIAMLSWLQNRDFLADLDVASLLRKLSDAGIVDGVTRRREATEDGMTPDHAEALVAALQALVSQATPSQSSLSQSTLSTSPRAPK